MVLRPSRKAQKDHARVSLPGASLFGEAFSFFFPCSGFVACVCVFSFLIALFSLLSSLITKTGVETLQDVSFLYQKGHCEHQRNGFLQVRMAGMRQNNKKKLLKKKKKKKDVE